MPPRIRLPRRVAQPEPRFIRVPQPPLPFARLQRGLRGYRWWRPLVAMLLSVVYLFGMGLLIGIILGIAVALGGFTLDESVLEGPQEQLMAQASTDPGLLVLLLGSVILMLPAVVLGCLSAGLRPWRHELSVEYRIRWRWLAVTLLPAAVIVVSVQLLSMVAMAVLGNGLGALTSIPESIRPSDAFAWRDFALLSLIVIAVVPVQSLTEEVVFRGLLLQSFAAWIPQVWLAAVPGIVLFVFSHGYGLSGQIAIAMFAVTTVVLTVRTGGIEAAVSLHAVNNIFVFLLEGAGLTVSAGDASGQARLEAFSGLITLGSEVLICGGYLLWVLPMARRRRITVLRAQPDRVHLTAVAYWQPQPVMAGGYR